VVRITGLEPAVYYIYRYINALFAAVSSLLKNKIYAKIQHTYNIKSQQHTKGDNKMKHIKLVLIVICITFILAASCLVYAGFQEENRSHLTISDIVSSEPVAFENLKAVMC